MQILVLIIFVLIIYLIAVVGIKLWPLLLIWFLISLLKNRNRRSNSTYSNRSNNRSRTTFYGNMSQEEAEEFFRQFMGGAGSFNQNTYRSYGNNYGRQSGYQGSNQYGGFYQEDKTKYYKILGVEKNATPDELKKAYFKLVKEHHPDRFTNSSESEKKYHEDKMKQINEAYDKLTKN